ncbi:Uncharacterised protein [Streptococcus pneumoniae]|nr:Uncharacterised protein [Streptococcus pneumoniae]VJS10094.1 Uncharacterised protein [Streptococcus pneumoniae]VKA18709.1 Uncharacterised protein [Streptococcus pneumoniae]VLG23157.1 Uncharacterised protein [Streptococcus pneumoniae]VMN30401.1 Uncharacterised protein [Streptococcus pneumoniae]
MLHQIAHILFQTTGLPQKGKSYKNSLSEEKEASTTGVNYYQLKTTVFTLN